MCAPSTDFRHSAMTTTCSGQQWRTAARCSRTTCSSTARSGYRLQQFDIKSRIAGENLRVGHRQPGNREGDRLCVARQPGASGEPVAHIVQPRRRRRPDGPLPGSHRRARRHRRFRRLKRGRKPAVSLRGPPSLSRRLAHSHVASRRAKPGSGGNRVRSLIDPLTHVCCRRSTRGGPEPTNEVRTRFVGSALGCGSGLDRTRPGRPTGSARPKPRTRFERGSSGPRSVADLA